MPETTHKFNNNISMNRTLITCLLILSAILFSCNKKRNKYGEAEKTVTEWMDKTIQFPDKMVLSVYGRDTLSTSFPDTPYKILLYTDSTGCTSCKLIKIARMEGANT
jgi:hypothetical protein